MKCLLPPRNRLNRHSLGIFMNIDFAKFKGKQFRFLGAMPRDFKSRKTALCDVKTGLESTRPGI